MKFRYKKLGNILRPILPVELIYGDNKQKIEVLVDSGADHCFIHGEIGALLGINIKDGKPGEVVGIAGKAQKTYKHTIEIDVSGWKYKTEVYFIPNFKSPYSLMGQYGFFNLFIVKFDLLKGEFELLPKKKKKLNTR